MGEPLFLNDTLKMYITILILLPKLFVLHFFKRNLSKNVRGSIIYDEITKAKEQLEEYLMGKYNQYINYNSPLDCWCSLYLLLTTVEHEYMFLV